MNCKKHANYTSAIIESQHGKKMADPVPVLESVLSEALFRV